MKIVIISILLILNFCNLKAQKTDSCKYQLVKDILELEYNEYFSIVDTSINLQNTYLILDSIVYYGSKSILEFEKNNLSGKPINEYIQQLLTENKMDKIENTIREFLSFLQLKIYENFNFELDFSKKNNLFLDVFLKNENYGKTDCDINSFILYAIALENNLPIVPILTYRHVYVMWELNPEFCVTYETLTYKTSFKPQKEFFSSNAKLKLNTKARIEVTTLNNISTIWVWKKDFKNYDKYCLKTYNMALDIINKNNIDNYYLIENLDLIIKNLNNDGIKIN